MFLVQDAGTNTDAETRSISTQTAVDSDTQTELSYVRNFFNLDYCHHYCILADGQEATITA